MPALRVTLSTGEVADDPTPAALRDLVARTARAGAGAFLVVEQCADASGETYLQAIDVGGQATLEYRDGSQERHYRARADDPRTVADVVVAWAAGVPDWAAPLDWHRLRPLRWWHRLSSTAVPDAI